MVSNASYGGGIFARQVHIGSTLFCYLTKRKKTKRCIQNINADVLTNVPFYFWFCSVVCFFYSRLCTFGPK